MVYKPKMLFFVFVVVACSLHLCCADADYFQENNEYSDEGRALSLAAANHPAVVAGGGLVTLGLIGPILGALATVGKGATNRRSSYDDPYYYDERQDYATEGNARYAQNVRNFEEKTFRSAARTALRGMRNVRFSTRRFGKALKHGVRAMGHNTVQGMAAMARSTGHMAKSAGKGMQAMARTAGKGLVKAGSVARLGVSKVGNRLGRVGLRTQRFGRKLAGVGVAAARGLRHVKNSYRRNAIQARASLGNGIYAAGEGISRVGETVKGSLKTVSRGYKNYVNRLGTAYQRSIRRLGHVGPSVGNAVQDSVSRIGEIASESAATLGGIATDVTDQVSRVAEAASSIPKSLSNVAEEKKVQDCFLQAMCYLSTPYLSQNEVKRRKRALKSISENGEWENLQHDDGDVEEEYRDLNEEYRRNRPEFFDNYAHMDDCEVFECGVATFGRKVVGAVRKFGNR